MTGEGQKFYDSLAVHKMCVFTCGFSYPSTLALGIVHTLLRVTGCCQILPTMQKGT